LDEGSVDPRLVGYLKAYRAFVRDARPGPCVLLETPLADPVLGFAGQPDQVRPLSNRLAVLDLKSGAEARWHHIQTAAYDHLVRTPGDRLVGTQITSPLARFTLYLRKDGQFRLVEHTSRHDFKVFQAALVLDHYKGNDR
jgi:hypothetical protein